VSGGGELIDGRYELAELVGTGGMSSVYRARDTLLERDVALKIMHAHHLEDGDYVERFEREARTVAQLSHPNIVTVIDRGEVKGRPFIVFEYIGGDTLDKLLERDGALPVDEALRIVIGAARGLAFAHRHGLVHRDVKPQNILLNGSGQPKVTDFGIARSLDVKKGVTQTGTVLGTSNYIAPEQANGEGATAESDVYSLGVVLFELLTGRRPFSGDNFVAVAMKHINEPPPSVLDLRRDVPPRVAAAVARALMKDPRDRFPSMESFAAELDACLHDLRGGVADSSATVITAPPVRGPRPARPAHRHRRPPRRAPLLVALIALAALAVIAVAAIALHGNNSVLPGGSSGNTTTTGGSGDGLRPEGRRHRARRRRTEGDGRQPGDVLDDGALQRPGLRRARQGRRRARARRAVLGRAQEADPHDRHAGLHGGRQGGKLARVRAGRLVGEDRERQHDVRPQRHQGLRLRAVDHAARLGGRRARQRGDGVELEA
jgi:serine/threonine-protein kinase